MSILRRDDGMLLVLQPYRELLKNKSAALLKREFFLLSQQHGVYSRIFKQPDGQFEAVFARDHGYLLGESVWQHFGKPRDLLYCEALPEKNQALVVVVRNNHVHLDAKISYSQLAEELASLQVGSAQFSVYVYGDVPISETGEEGKFVLDAERVKIFMRIPEPLWETLPLQSPLNLLSIESAVTELKLNQRRYQVAAAIVAVVVVGFVCHWFSTTASTSTVVQASDPLQQYAQALTASDPTLQLQQLVKQLPLAYSVAGWVPTTISYNAESVQVEMHSLGGSINSLLQWAHEHDRQVTLTSSGAQLTLPLAVVMRQSPQTILNTQQNLAVLVDRMMKIMPTKSVQIAATTSHGVYTETTINIALTNGVAPDVLSLIGGALTNLPVNLAGGTLTLNNGLLSGTLQLTLLGN